MERRSSVTLKIKKVREGADIPKIATPGSAGMDITACIDGEVTVKSGETVGFPTGIAIELPVGFAAFIYARSGLAIKHGLSPANCVGVIDSDYRGEIIVGLHNSSAADYVIKPHERIAQLIVGELPRVTVEECEDLSDTLRAAGGFGSTGRM